MIDISPAPEHGDDVKCASCKRPKKVYDVRIGDDSIRVCLRCLEKLGDKILQVSMADDFENVEI